MDRLLDYEEQMWERTRQSQAAMPELNEAYYGALRDAVYKEGAVDLKTKRLMSLAIAIHDGCKPCMISQSGHALGNGATAEEILETCEVAISMGGTLTWSNVLTVVEYLRERGLLPEEAGETP
jgi:AhpD family alkylhydroperoxidase